MAEEKTIIYHQKDGSERVRSAKSKGFTKGRPSNSEIVKRQKLIYNIFESNDFNITKELFWEELKGECNKNGITLPSDSTIHRDRKFLKDKYHREFNFCNVRKRLSTGTLDTKFDILNFAIRRYLRQIRLLSANADIILTPTNREALSYNKDSNDITQIMFIFTKKGFEDITCSTFQEELGCILYTASHNCCAEIVFDEKDTELVLNPIYTHILNSLFK